MILLIYKVLDVVCIYLRLDHNEVIPGAVLSLNLCLVQDIFVSIGHLETGYVSMVDTW